MQRAACVAADNAGAAAARRRLQQASEVPPPSHRRRMTSGTGTRYNAGDGKDDAATVMTPLHFFGIWIIWLVTAFCLLAARFGLYLHTRSGMFTREVFPGKESPGKMNGLARQASAGKILPKWEIDARNADVDLNNPSSMLRYVISEMAEMQGRVSDLQDQRLSQAAQRLNISPWQGDGKGKAMRERTPEVPVSDEGSDWSARQAARSWLVQSEEAARGGDN